MAAVCCVTNGLMRATESTYVLVAVDGIVPVTVRVVCLYDSKRAVFYRQFGWHRRIFTPVPYTGREFYFYLKGTVIMSFIRLTKRW